MSVLAINSPLANVASATPVPSITPEEMSRLPDDGRVYELANGHLIEKGTSDVAHLVANNLKGLLVIWSHSAKQGRSFVGATFRCFPQAPGMVRRPNVAFISTERLAGYSWGHGHIEIVPDVAVEVVSPHDEVIELERKIQDYHRSGVRRVWVVIPDLEIVRIHRAPGDVSELVGDAVLADENVLPGFKCRLAELFALPAAPAPTTEPQSQR